MPLCSLPDAENRATATRYSRTIGIELVLRTAENSPLLRRASAMDIFFSISSTSSPMRRTLGALAVNRITAV